MKLRLGLVGCGHGAEHYLTSVPRFKDITVQAIADFEAALASSHADGFDVRADTVEDILSADDIDMIVNLTPPHAHFDVSRAALTAGKHVYCERPFVLTLMDGLTLQNLAIENGVRLGAAPDAFLGGVHQQARLILDAGEIGHVVTGTCHVMNHGVETTNPKPDAHYQQGGGPMVYVGAIYVANLVQLLGPVARVYSVAAMPFAKRVIGIGDRTGKQIDVTTPTTFNAVLEFRNGATITFAASWDVWAHRHGPMELYGTEGSLFLPDAASPDGSVEQSGMGTQIVPVPRTDHPFQNANDSLGIAGCADMARAIASGQPHRCNSTFALHIIEVTLGIIKAGQTRAPIVMETTCKRPDPLSADAARAMLV